MELVELTAADYDRVIDLWRRAGLSFRAAGRDSAVAFGRQLATGAQTVLGLEEGNQLVGVVVITHDSRKGWINRLAIDPAYRRQGWGTQLLAAAEDHLHRQGMEVIAALIEAGNKSSLAMFERAGYVHSPEVLYVSKRPGDNA